MRIKVLNYQVRKRNELSKLSTLTLLLTIPVSSPCSANKFTTDVIFFIAFSGSYSDTFGKKKRRRIKNMINNLIAIISHKVRPNVILRKPST